MPMKPDKTTKEINIVQADDPILRKKPRLVKPEDIGTPRIQKIIADMKTAVDSQKDGIAIAAPQIGQSLRIFVVSGKSCAKQTQNSKVTKTISSSSIQRSSNCQRKCRTSRKGACLSAGNTAGSSGPRRATISALGERRQAIRTRRLRPPGPSLSARD